MPVINIFGKMLLKATISDPEATGKVFLVMMVVLFFPLLVIIAPFVLFLSTPLAPPSVTEMYVQGTRQAIETTAEGYGGPVVVNWHEVLVIDAVRKNQDFSGVQVHEVKDLAMGFIEQTGTYDVSEKTGYKRVYDPQGRFVGLEPVYTVTTVPIYRVKSFAEVMESLGFTQEQREWAHNMREAMN
ncbi:MAG: hypothetical protein KGZ53_02650 [Peptococcaceae bacterium]|nr:hypothetical protein [Peptococcaceae bacterium]